MCVGQPVWDVAGLLDPVCGQCEGGRPVFIVQQQAGPLEVVSIIPADGLKKQGLQEPPAVQPGS